MKVLSWTALIVTVAATLLATGAIHEARAAKRALVAQHESKVAVERRLARAEASLAAARLLLSARVPESAVPEAEACPATVSAIDAPRTAEQEQSEYQGQAIVDRAIAQSRWSDEDSIALASLSALRDQDRARLMQRVSAAVNAGQLRLDLERMPY
jgi:hypothetical protein